MSGSHIKIRRIPGNWTIRASGAVLGESSNALELIEGDMQPVVYFPRDDIGMAFLQKNDHTTHCPHKGDANYFDLKGKSGLIENAAWTYETPLDGVSEIAGCLAFHPDKVTVEEV